MKADKEKALDDLFRTGLENPAGLAHYREDDWDALEDMLDKHKKRAGIIYWLPLLSSAAAMLILVLGWFLIKQSQDKDKQPVLVKNDKVNEIPMSSPGRKTLPAPVKNDAGNQQAGIQTKAGVVNTYASGKATKATSQSSSNSMYASSGAGHRRLLNTKAVDIIPPDNVVTHNENAAHGDLLAANTTTLDIAELNTPLLTTELDLPKASNIAITTLVKSNKASIKQNPFNRPVFALSVMASPDINGVSSFQNSRVGTNAGLLFSVSLKKFTLSTGALYSKKPYVTDFDNYHTNYKFKTDPDNVSADCRVLDIPINIDYQVYSKSRNKFSVGTGLSSYIMLRENYHYNYATPYINGPTDYNIINKNQHILGVLNLDATYQRRINSKFSLGVEPYLKIPLTNIGASQVKLQSTGVAIGVTWNINSLSKP